MTKTPSINTVRQTPNLPIISTPASNRNDGPNTINLQSVTSTPTSTRYAETSVTINVDILSPVKKGKLKRNESNWERNLLKAARSSGKGYLINSKNLE